jgi:hypothetical protein
MRTRNQRKLHKAAQLTKREIIVHKVTSVLHQAVTT